MRFTRIILLGGLLSGLFGALASGCAVGEASPPEEVALQSLPTASPTPRATITPTPLVLPIEPTLTGPQRLSLWLPEPIAPLDNANAAAQRESWIAAFEALEDDLTVTIRLKRASDVGGVLQTLRSANLVAPSSLPDLALLRRADMLTAVGLGLIHPLDPVALTSITEDLHPAVIDLGMVDDRLFALPFSIDVAHLAVYGDAMPDESDPTAWSFESVLTRGGTLLFPAGRANIVNETFLAQYRAAAGDPERDSLPVDIDALEAVLGFYQSALEAGMISSSVLDYTASGDYISFVLTGEAAAGALSSSSYLTLIDSEANIAYAPLPTLDGNPATVIDGWMWVITTADAGRQAAALRFLNWVFDVDRHSTYMNAIHMLPTGRTTLRQIDDDDYALFADSLLNAATLPLTDAAGSAAGRAMQGALVAVLRGTLTAVDAAQDVVEQAG